MTYRWHIDPYYFSRRSSLISSKENVDPASRAKIYNSFSLKTKLEMEQLCRHLTHLFNTSGRYRVSTTESHVRSFGDRLELLFSISECFGDITRICHGIRIYRLMNNERWIVADAHAADTPSLALALYAALTTPIISEDEEDFGFSAEVLQQLDMRREYLSCNPSQVYILFKYQNQSQSQNQGHLNLKAITLIWFWYVVTLQVKINETWPILWRWPRKNIGKTVGESCKGATSGDIDRPHKKQHRRGWYQFFDSRAPPISIKHFAFSWQILRVVSTSQCFRWFDLRT